MYVRIDMECGNTKEGCQNIVRLAYSDKSEYLTSRLDPVHVDVVLWDRMRVVSAGT